MKNSHESIARGALTKQAKVWFYVGLGFTLVCLVCFSCFRCCSFFLFLVIYNSMEMFQFVNEL